MASTERTSPQSAPNPDSVRQVLIVLRAQAGDERAFADLMQRHGEALLRYLTGLVGDDADDLFQETWLAVYRHLATLHDPAAFQVWLFRSARHRALNWLRRHRRERELVVDAPLDAIATDDESDDTPTALDHLDAGRIDAAMHEMPPPQREVLILRFRDDLSYAQIANVTAVPINTVRTRLHHAKKRLAHLLSLGAPDARHS
ncbi:MAG: RNA polymerase sigma factor [Gemmatimonadaceae bacterium]|nr:RNA polymerase sigma factor [Gemmatimonadaceae bacterium]MCW5826823.1 RNA polymerase sigma factor [Gemmatimonadaceae bacterium]